MKDQQSYIPFFVSYLTDPCSRKKHQPRHGNSFQWKALWKIHGDKEQTQEKKNFIEQIKAPIFFEKVLVIETK